jgi:tyrosinase
MVDRAFALWQALWPNSYVEPQAQVQGTYWYKQESIQDVNSPLKPFYSDPQGDFWTAASVRDLTTFGYTYSELQSNNPSDVKAAVNNLYGPSFTVTASKKHRRKRPRSTAVNDRLYQINVRAPKNTNETNYFIDFFFGAPATEDPSTWPSDTNLISTYAVISMSIPDTSTITTTGVVSLNSHLEALVDQRQLESMDENHVLTLLKNGLAWRVRNGANEPLDPETLPELKVAVASIGVQHSEDSREFPTYVGDWTMYPEVTHGQSGGLQFGDPI